MIVARFVLPISPRSVQFNKRLAVRDGKPHFYNDSAKRVFYRDIALIANGYAPPAPLAVAMRLSATFVFKRPKRFDLPAKMPKGPAGESPYIAKPDLVNLIKGLEDALKTCAFWDDDCRIAKYGEMGKVYAARGDDAHIRVLIETL